MVVGLGIAAGALFIACIVLILSLCEWRIRYSKLQKQVRDQGDGIVNVENGDNPERNEEERASASVPVASGAL